MNLAIGIDLGGTKIKGLLATRTGKVVAENALPSGDSNATQWQRNVLRVSGSFRNRRPPLWKLLGLPHPDWRIPTRTKLRSCQAGCPGSKTWFGVSS